MTNNETAHQQSVGEMRLQVENAILQSRLLGTHGQLLHAQAEIAQFRHRDLLQQIGQMQQLLADRQKAEGLPVDVPALSVNTASRQ